MSNNPLDQYVKERIVGFFKNNTRVKITRNCGYLEVSLQIKPDDSVDKWETICMDDMYIGDSRD